ncbi:MAG: SDR family NAD(P)-dependent oxidoreductase [Christensenellales bacterium]|jgi:3-oxoacyl-[acyl-carrier protein] reductase
MGEQRVAIITGAARGIGRAIAQALSRQGAATVIADIDAEGARRVAQEIEGSGGRALAIPADVSIPAQVADMVREAADQLGRIDILVNNAGILSATSIEALREDEWDRVMAINVKSAVFASQQALPWMIRQGWGRIINISSLSGRMGGVSAGCAYSASKAALIGLTMSLARQTAGKGITVNAVAPGTTRSDIIRRFSAEQMERIMRSIPVGRLGEPEEIAALVAFLAQDTAGFITGAVIDINGGMFMG